MRHVLITALLASGTVFALGCDTSQAPTAPMAAMPLASVISSSSFTFVTDGSVSGSAYALTAFDGASLISGSNKQRSFQAAYDAGSRFYAAKLDKYQPGDPCREAAVSYNGAGAVGSDFGLDEALTILAGSRCLARVIVAYPTDPILPPNPIRIRSFQPIASAK